MGRISTVSIIDNAKDIAQLVKKLDDIELYRKIVELEEQIIELTQSKNDLESRCKELQEALEISEDMTFDNPYYFREGDDIPFCAKCWETNKKALHLTQHHQMTAVWFCQTCGAKYPDLRKR